MRRHLPERQKQKRLECSRDGKRTNWLSTRIARELFLGRTFPITTLVTTGSLFSPHERPDRKITSPRHGNKVTSVALPSRYIFPSALRTKTRVVENSVSGSS
jgi:hypothetical protein